MTGEPATIAATLKAAGEVVAVMWARGALLLWCITAAGLLVFIALAVTAYWHLGDAAAILKSHGTWLGLAILVCGVFAGFKAYSERAARPLVLIANEQESAWNQAKQPSGQVITALALRFQVTNLSDGSVMLSAIRLKRPWVRRRTIMQALLSVRHPSGQTYSRENPIMAHSLSYGSAQVTIDHPVGRVRNPMRVVISVQDHAGRWYKLAFPHVRMIGNPPG